MHWGQICLGDLRNFNSFVDSGGEGARLVYLSGSGSTIPHDTRRYRSMTVRKRAIWSRNRTIFSRKLTLPPRFRTIQSVNN
jgi:hypothetical protein